MVGSMTFFTGMALNIQADEILRNIRKRRTDKQYDIPRGGLFEYVSCANYGKSFLVEPRDTP